MNESRSEDFKRGPLRAAHTAFSGWEFTDMPGCFPTGIGGAGIWLRDGIAVSNHAGPVRISVHRGRPGSIRCTARLVFAGSLPSIRRLAAVVISGEAALPIPTPKRRKLLMIPAASGTRWREC
jgi:hypothetical protein